MNKEEFRRTRRMIRQPAIHRVRAWQSQAQQLKDAGGGGNMPPTVTVVGVLPLQPTLTVPFEQLIPKSVVSVSPGDDQLPLDTGNAFSPLHPVDPPLVPVHDVAPVDVQCKVVSDPEFTFVGDALRLQENVAPELMKN